MNRFSIADCTTVDAALSQLKDGAVVKAGGVDLLDRMKDGIRTADAAGEYPQCRQSCAAFARPIRG